MYNGVLQSEVIAASDVLAKPTVDGIQLFNITPPSRIMYTPLEMFDPVN